MCEVCAQLADNRLAPNAEGTTTQSITTSSLTPFFASAVEAIDAAADITSTSTMAVGDTFSGSLETRGDRDWVAIEFEEGKSYDISLFGSGSDGVRDTYLRIYDQFGTLIASNNNGGAGKDSLLSDFIASHTGTFFISAGAKRDRGTGDYKIEVSENDPSQSEMDDAAADGTTTYSMSVGESFDGTLDTKGDRDWIAIQLNENQTYDISLTGGGAGNVRDTYLRVYDIFGNLVAKNNNGGEGKSSLVSDFTVDSSGIYYISAGAKGDKGTGNYHIEVTGEDFDLGSIENPNSDADANTSTRYTMDVNGVFSGTLDSRNDRDWVAIELVEGENYDIALTGIGSDGVPNTVLRVYDADGNLIALDKNSGEGHSSLLADFSVASTGTYYIAAASNKGRGQGDFEISVTTVIETPTPPEPVEPTPVEPAPEVETNSDYDAMAYQLTTGFWEAGVGSTRSYNVEVGGTITYNHDGLTASGQNLAEKALELWSDATGLQFEYSASSAQMTFDDEQTGANSESARLGGTIFNSTINISKGWLNVYGTSLNTYSFQTYIHEIGHALGLGHAGNYNGSATFDPSIDPATDSWQTTVMSYFSQNENTLVDATRAYAITPQVADIIAIRELYGTAGTTRTGDTVYGSGADSGDTFGLITSVNVPITYTIVDDGGIDTLNFNDTFANQLIDLNAEAISNVRGLTGNVIISRDTLIENAISGSGDDTLIGNLADNRLEGGAGNDTLTGNDGADTFVFAADSSHDIVTDFEDGVDIIEFGFGIDDFADLAISMDGADTLIEFSGGQVTLIGTDHSLINADDFQFA